MKSFLELPHTADMRLRVEASTLAELFTAALEGMMRAMTQQRDAYKPERAAHEATVQLRAQDATTLLVDFLNEALTHAHTNRAIYNRVVFERISEDGLQSTLSGFAVRGFRADIKAATHHEAHVRKNIEGNYETIVVFDV